MLVYSIHRTASRHVNSCVSSSHGIINAPIVALKPHRTARVTVFHGNSPFVSNNCKHAPAAMSQHSPSNAVNLLRVAAPVYRHTTGSHSPSDPAARPADYPCVGTTGRWVPVARPCGTWQASANGSRRRAVTRGLRHSCSAAPSRAGPSRAESDRVGRDAMRSSATLSPPSLSGGRPAVGDISARTRDTYSAR